MTNQPLSECKLRNTWISRHLEEDFCYYEEEDVKQSIQEFLKEVKESLIFQMDAIRDAKDLQYCEDIIFFTLDTLAKQKFGDKLLC